MTKEVGRTLPARRTLLVPKGLKPVRRKLADGRVRVYWYHRGTGRSLQHDPETAEGLLEVAALDRRLTAMEAARTALSGSYAELWAKYVQSPEWRNLKPRTRSDYQAVRDWLGKAAEKKNLGTMRPADVFALRDKADAEKGRRFANYVVQVLRLTMAWGKKRDHCRDNPALDVDLIRKPTSQADANRAWTVAEAEVFAAGAPRQLLVPFALGLFAGMRQGDALIATWRAYDRAVIRWTAGKNGEACMAPVTGQFKLILDAALAVRGDAVQIATTAYGTPWTASGFRASFFKRIGALREAKRLGDGLTFHGLRHSVASWARDDGESESRVAAAIGDRSTAMAAVYGRESDREGARLTVLEAVQKRFENSDWKTDWKTLPGPKR
jgi:integrase